VERTRATGSSYRLSGVVVSSEIALPATPASATTGADAIHFRVAPAPSAPPPEAWDLRSNGVSLGTGPGGFVLRLPGCADFWIDPTGATVTGVPVGACPPETLAQLFLDQVLPLVLHLRGRFAFHASSVALGGRALVAFLGQAGAGKSTLASSLARGGGEVLFSDDCLAVEVAGADVLAHPSYASARLWAASAEALFADRGALPLASPRTAKLRAALPVAGAPLPLRRLYLLAVAEGAPAITHLSRRDALVALTSHLYRLDAGDRGRLAGELDLLEKVVARVPVAGLAYRRAYGDLPAVRAAIVADLSPSAPSG
jgi:hypothetical protein